MKIVFFDFNTNFGGAPQGAVHLAERLSARHEVHIVDAYGKCEPYRQAVREANLAYHVLMPKAEKTYIGEHGLKRIIAFIKQMPDLSRLHRRLANKIIELNPDVVWVMNEKSLTFVTMNRQLRKYPCVLYVQGWATPDQMGMRLRWLMKHRAAAVIAVSTATKNQLYEAGVPEYKLFLGSMTIDINKVRELSKKPPTVPLPGQELFPKLLILAARPERAKGHLTAFKAIARLKSEGYNPALWMTGKVAVGSKKDFLDELQRLSEKLNIVENVFFLGWQDNIPAVIQAADICILPSHSEGLPRSILESMVLGKPVVATPVGGVGDSIKDGSTGFLMPIEDDDALANLTQRLINNPPLMEHVVTQAYDFVMKHFHPELHTAGIEKIFHEITGK